MAAAAGLSQKVSGGKAEVALASGFSSGDGFVQGQGRLSCGCESEGQASGKSEWEIPTPRAAAVLLSMLEAANQAPLLEARLLVAEDVRINVTCVVS